MEKENLARPSDSFSRRISTYSFLPLLFLCGSFFLQRHTPVTVNTYRLRLFYSSPVFFSLFFLYSFAFVLTRHGADMDC